MAKLSSIVFLPTACCALFLAIPLKAAPQTKTVYGTVRSVEDKAVAQTEIRTNTGASDVTTDSGGFGLPLVPPLKVGFPVIFYVTDWSVVEPCVLARGRTYLPDPEAEEITVRALRKGDKRLLSRGSIGCIVMQKAAQFVRPIRPAPPTGLKITVSGLFNPSEPAGSQIVKPNLFHLYPYATIVGSTFLLLPSSRYSLLSTKSVSLDEGQDSPDDFLQDQAMELGFTTEQLSNAIKEWGKSATDPYEQGLAALYEQRYLDASRLILESINASPKGPIDRYVSLARAEYEQKHYDAARSALDVALAAHPDDPLLLQNLEAINRAQKGEGPANNS